METELIKLKASDYGKIKPYFELRDFSTCEGMILDTYLWNEYYDTKYFINEKGLMWVFSANGQYFTGTPMCKKEDLKSCFKVIREYFNNVLNQKLVFLLADEMAVSELELSEEDFEITECRDYFDYIYDAQKLKTLSGKKYHKKKNHVNAFLKEYEGRYEYKTIDCSNQSDIVEFLDKWNEEKVSEDIYNRLKYEKAGINNVLRDCRFIERNMCGIYIDGKLEAFSIGSYAKTQKMAVIHIEKANPNIRGLYNFINQQFLIHAFPDAEIVNREDDMGIEGLRKAKMSYNPIRLVEKYNIIEK